MARSRPSRKQAARPGRLVVCLSDTHCGHRLGLCNPATELEEIDGQGNRYHWPVQLTEAQRAIWEKFERDKTSVVEIAAGRPVVLLVNGDLTHGLKHPQDLMSNYLHHQVQIAYDVVNAWLADSRLTVSAVRLVQGTAAHTMSGSTEPLVAQLINMRYHQTQPAAVIFHGLFTVEGVTIDAVHKGPYPGSREWGKGNVATLALRSMMLRELLDHHTPPRVVLRAHYHRYQRVTDRIESDGATYESDLFITPSYCGMDLHGHHATQGLSWQSHGLLVLEVADGKLMEVYPLVDTLDLRTREAL